MSFKITPLSDHVLIEPLKEEKKREALSCRKQPKKIDKKRARLSPWARARSKDGPSTGSGQARRVPLEVKKGDVVLFTKYGPNEIKINGKEYLIAKEEDILAILK